MNKPKKCRVKIMKVSPEEEQAIQDKADMYSRGNWSQWVRKAALSYDPAQDNDYPLPNEATSQ